MRRGAEEVWSRDEKLRRGNKERTIQGSKGYFFGDTKQKGWPQLKKELEKREMDTWTDSTEEEKTELKLKLDKEIEKFHRDHYMAKYKKKKSKKKKSKKKKSKKKKLKKKRSKKSKKNN